MNIRFLQSTLYIIFGNMALGIIFAILNFILMPFLTAKLMSLAGVAFLIGMGIAAFAAPFLGTLSDKIGNREIFIILLFLINVFSCLGIPISTKSILFCCAVIFVTTAFTLQPIYSSFVADRSLPKIRAKRYGITIGTTTFTSFLASLVIKTVFDVSPERTFSILALAILGLLIPFSIGTLQGNRFQKSFAPNDQDAFSGNILKDLRLRRFFLSQAGAWFAIGGIFPLLTSFLRDALDFSLGSASLLTGFFSLLSGCATLSVGYLLKYSSKELLYYSTCMLLAIIFSILATILGLPVPVLTKRIVTIFILSLLYLTVGTFYPLGPTILSTLAPSEIRGKAFGVNHTFIIMSQGIAVQYFTLLLLRFGFLTVLISGALSGVLAALFFKQTVDKRDP